MATLEVIKQYGLPIDRIVHVEIMATKSIPADFPDMIEFKQYADNIIKKRYGIVVEHIYAPKSYEEYFYRKFKSGKRKGSIYGFPYRNGAWCNSRLKLNVLNQFKKPDIIQYLGISADEPVRFNRLAGTNCKAPLYEYGWTSKMRFNWCKDNGLLSPVYNGRKRAGCWFCHNQSIEDLRILRKEYPDLWSLMKKWDNDSPTTFKATGRTIHDFDYRFSCEDEGYITADNFNWNMLICPHIQLELF